MILDDKDKDLLTYKWRIVQDYWRRSPSVRYKETLLHRIIASRIIGRELLRSEQVDHIDRNKLNNTRSNLRVVTQTQNSVNRTKQKNNKSGYKGVYKGRYLNPWRAIIGFRGKKVFIGTFKTKEEAAIAYNKKALELFGEYAHLNVIVDENV